MSYTIVVAKYFLTLFFSVNICSTKFLFEFLGAIKVVLLPAFSRTLNLESKLIDSCPSYMLANGQFWEASTHHCPYNFSSFLSALASNIIKLVKMWPGGTPDVVVGLWSLDRPYFFTKGIAVMSCSCEYWVMAVCKTSLCLEVAERQQWPRLYLLGRPRSRGVRQT